MPSTTAKRPCKYGARIDGKCPPKPRLSASTSTRSTTPSRSSTKAPKPPCKYGPRTASGLCPKKPRSTRANPTRVTARTTSGAAEQAVKVLTNPRATREQKGQAIEKVGETLATETVRKVAKTERAKALGKQALEAAKQGPGLLPKVLTMLGIVSVSPEKFRAAQRTEKAMNAIRADFKRRGQKLSRKDEFTLAKQHMDYFLNNPE